MAGPRPNLDSENPAETEAQLYHVPQAKRQTPPWLWWLGVVGCLLIALSLLFPWHYEVFALRANDPSVLPGTLGRQTTRGIDTFVGRSIVPLVLGLSVWLGMIEHRLTLESRDHTVGLSLMVLLWLTTLAAFNVALFQFARCATCLASDLGPGIFVLLLGVLLASLSISGLKLNDWLKQRREAAS